MRTIVCLTGRSAVGKSTVSRAASMEHELPLFSLGNYQKEKYGNPTNPTELERLWFGKWGEYLDEITARTTRQGIIVEGIYNLDFMERVRERFAGDIIRLIAVRSPDRLLFMEQRSGLEGEAAKKELKERDRIKILAGLCRVIRNVDGSITNRYGELDACVLQLSRHIGVQT